jgi:hypothetical protein
MGKKISKLTIEEWDKILSGDPAPLLEEGNLVMEVEDATTSTFSHPFFASASITGIKETNSQDYKFDSYISTALNLRTLELENATEITSAAFASATANFALETIIAPKATSIKNLYKCKQLTYLDAPSITKLNGRTFESHPSIKTVNLPGLTQTDIYEFNACKKLESVNAPGLEVMKDYMFTGCSSLKTINFPKLTEIRDYVFGNCTSLTSITAPLLETIGLTSFKGCSSLSSIDNLTNLTNISSYSFSDCTSLTSINLPNLKTIGVESFKGCSNLTYVNLPNLETIEGMNAFSRTAIREFNAPKLEKLASNSFSSCTSEELIVRGVKTFGNEVFYQCKNLRKLVLTDTTNIGYRPFSYCGDALEELYLPVPQVVVVTSYLGATLKNLTVYVPENLVDAYKADQMWSGKNIVGWDGVLE